VGAVTFDVPMGFFDDVYFVSPKNQTLRKKTTSGCEAYQACEALEAGARSAQPQNQEEKADHDVHAEERRPAGQFSEQPEKIASMGLAIATHALWPAGIFHACTLPAP
jgi:hypothetical protein